MEAGAFFADTGLHATPRTNRDAYGLYGFGKKPLV
jgi:hypothetical protein